MLFCIFVTQMKHSKIPLSQTLVALCKAHNIKHVVISPGSRNAPLTIGFTHDDYFKSYSIVDERCAGFFALGIAQQLKEPVALVCTSGSALLNYYPAISEAYYSRIPLVVLSADRPKHLVDIGDGQTIKQKNVYGEHVVYSTNLKLDLKDRDKDFQEETLPIFKNIEHKLERFLGLQEDIQSSNESDINFALNSAKLQSGPVHINCPFDEPLYETVAEVTVVPRPFQLKKDELDFEAFEIESSLSVWQNAKRKLILVGVNAPNTIDQQWLDELAKDDSVIVFTETTSNLHHSEFFSGIDQIIAPLEGDEFAKLQPEILLTFGGLVVSKKVKVFLRKYKPEHHWHIDTHKANDTFFCLDKHIKTAPNTFLSSFLPKLTHVIKSDYKPFWRNIKQTRKTKHKDYLETITFSDFTVFNSLLDSLPKNSQLQVGNSSAIRYTQLFKISKTIAVFCNRGTSGIDGSTSTAIGAAVVSQQRTTFITGDLSFFYDSNALWNNYIPNNFRIIVLNNQGGGIFRILPGHKNTENFDTFFETKHALNASQLCEMYKFSYQAVDSDATLNEALTTFYSDSEEPRLLEIFTPSRLNDEILLDYFKFIR